MKVRRISYSLVLVLALAGLATPALADHHSAFTDSVLANLADTSKKLIALAEATPADQFGWSPNIEVRTISEVYMHVVGTNLLLPAALGATPPEGVKMDGNPFALMSEWERTVTSKEDVVAKLKESFEYLEKALRSIEDLDTEVSLFGPPQPKRAYFLILLGHAHEHLGQSIAYARSIGIAPPWSRPMPSGDGGG